MSKFHINKHGVPTVCKAIKGNCPLGEHYETEESATVAINKKMESEYGFLPKDKSSNKGSSFTKEELLFKKDELVEEINQLKGIDRIRAKKELKRTEYALEGRDYDEEMHLEKEIREKRIEEQRKKDIESKLNAEKIANRKTIELPKSIEQYLVNRNWSRAKVSAYRGEKNLRAEVNTGTAMYGQGRYTTTDKSYAKKFGDVRAADLDELPVYPLRLRTVGGFQLMEQEIAREHGVNYRDLYTKMDASEMIQKMGYDGLTLGTGKDMIIVKYSEK